MEKVQRKSDLDNFTERRLLQTLFYQPEFPSLNRTTVSMGIAIMDRIQLFL